jgi:type II secretory pathway pseudopilin PulG
VAYKSSHHKPASWTLWPWPTIVLSGLLLCAVALFGWAIGQNQLEARDAKQVLAVQQQLQTVVAQAQSQHLPLSQTDNLVNAVKGTLPTGLHLDKSLKLSFINSARSAQFEVLPTGQVHLKQVVNFTMPVTLPLTPVVPLVTVDPTGASSRPQDKNQPSE